MFSKWVISHTYKCFFVGGNPLILTFDPNFRPGTSKISREFSDNFHGFQQGGPLVAGSKWNESVDGSEIRLTS